MASSEINLHHVTEVRIESKRGASGSNWINAYITNKNGEKIEICLFGVDINPIIVKLGEEE